MIDTPKQPRRDLLKLGAAAALAPFLPVLSREAKAATRPPRRFVIVFNANGVYAPEWVPRGEGREFELHGSLAALRPFKADLNILQGVHMKEHGNHLAHSGGPTMLTNWSWPHPTLAGGVTSIDQMVAAHNEGATRYPSIDFILYKNIGPHDGMSYRNGQYVRPEDNPYRAFERLFGDAGRAAGEPAGLRLARRKSVLDHARSELRRMQGALGGPEREQVEAHLSSVRELERTLFTKPPLSCRAPAAYDPAVDRFEHQNFPVVGRAFMDLAAAALACDATRVVTLMWNRQASKMRYPWLGAPYDAINHHSISHSEGAPRHLCAAIDRWHAEQFAYLLGRLKAVREGNGTLLDNTLVLWTSEFGTWTKMQHEYRNLPYVLAGGKWHFRTGRFLRYEDEPHGKVLTSIVQAMGLPTDNVGSTRFGTGPLAGLTT